MVLFNIFETFWCCISFLDKMNQYFYDISTVLLSTADGDNDDIQVLLSTADSDI